MIKSQDQLIDIYDVWYEPFYEQFWFVWIFRGLLFVLIIALVWYIYNKYKEKRTKIDCSVFACDELENLEKIHIVTEQDSKDCYFKLSSIIKRYLACRYHKIFEKLTDKEIVRHAELYVSDGDLRLLQKVLQGMLLIKFEHEFAVQEKFKKDILLMKEFIVNTSHPEDIKER